MGLAPLWLPWAGLFVKPSATLSPLALVALGCADDRFKW